MLTTELVTYQLRKSKNQDINYRNTLKLLVAHIIYLQMCIDDYQFRHESATRGKQCKRFIFQNQQGNHRIFFVNISQFEVYGNLCLCQILIHLSKKGLSIRNHAFYMPQLQIKIEAGDQCLVPFDALCWKDVYFKMEEISEEQNPDIQECILQLNQGFEVNDENQSILSVSVPLDEISCKDTHIQAKSTSQSTQHEAQLKQENHNDFNDQSYRSRIYDRKQKHQQKTVYEALTKVKEWRYLHEVANISLKNSATFVGLSKKTLDDYFLVVRIGEELGYYFHLNMYEKIGHLRHFIRNHPKKIQGRLPKSVKSFSLIPEPNLSQLIPEYKIDKLEYIVECK